MGNVKAGQASDSGLVDVSARPPGPTVLARRLTFVVNKPDKGGRVTPSVARNEDRDRRRRTPGGLALAELAPRFSRRKDDQPSVASL